jgi:hypothetical protein
MKDSHQKCSLCNYYEPFGRGNGYCRLLDAPVHGSLEACSLSIATFKKSEQCLVVRKTGQSDSYLKIYPNGDQVAYLPDDNCCGEVVGTITDYRN